MFLLCGDIGASNSRLAIIEVDEHQLRWRAKEFFKNSEFHQFTDILEKFLKANPIKIESASFGVAGPIVKGEVEITNLTWKLSETQIAQFLKIKRCFLLNDLEAIACGVASLEKKDFLEIIGGRNEVGTRAVIAPGSGIGEAILYWDGHQHRPMPTEGGHSSFSPTSPLQLELLQYLFKNWNHVSWERVLSGPGIYNIYEFLRDTKKAPEQLKRTTASEISEGALAADPLCKMTIELFFEILATESANLALKTLPRGGLFIAGGITPKLIKLLDHERFKRFFTHKGRMSDLLNEFKVAVILNQDVGMIGAARYAQLKRPFF